VLKVKIRVSNHLKECRREKASREGGELRLWPAKSFAAEDWHQVHCTHNVLLSWLLAISASSRPLVRSSVQRGRGQGGGSWQDEVVAAAKECSLARV
jgi:hypothetical protein